MNEVLRKILEVKVSNRGTMQFQDKASKMRRDSKRMLIISVSMVFLKRDEDAKYCERKR